MNTCEHCAGEKRRTDYFYRAWIEAVRERDRVRLMLKSLVDAAESSRANKSADLDQQLAAAIAVARTTLQ